ncbi:MAG: rRNA maturation RNase YbeY [Candidatus Pacebacteria bacterium]|jgi:probable rRNA maturation factor|nr:rRNA maturation RNase YbeY [Candidatus Paceibacterota bacterium]
MVASDTVSITRMTKGKLPSLPFLRIKNDVLGKTYDLSIVFATPKVSQALNKQFRDKDYPTNILSFPLSKTSGELVISLAKVRAGASEFGKSYTQFLGFLLIHGMLHLKGYEHGSTMEKYEARFAKKFGF